MTFALSSTAMVLAAGLGTRMRPLTLTAPKPLQLVGGKTMLDHALDRLVEAGITRAVVNTFYLAEQIESHLKNRRDIEIVISREDELLDTGGGIAKALPFFDGKPFFALNADLPWLDGKMPSLLRMKAAWNADHMDAMLLVMTTGKARGFGTSGDFFKQENGLLTRKETAPPRPFVYIGAQITTPALFDNPPERKFSNNLIFNRAETRQRLYGIEHDGTCFHVGTPEDLRSANELLRSGKGWAV